MSRDPALDNSRLKYPDEFLVAETDLGKDVSYHMDVARNSEIWHALSNNLSQLLRKNESIRDAERSRMDVIARFCQISFAHGEEIQNYGLESNIHVALIQCTEYSPRIAFSALSNLLTKNVRSADVVLKELSRTSEAFDPDHSDNLKDLPISALLLMRNSLNSPDQPGHVERCQLVCSSSILLRMLYRSSLIDRNIIIEQAEEEESLRLSLAIAIMDVLFNAGMAEHCVLLHEQIQTDGRLALTTKHEIYKYIDQYCYLDKFHASSKLDEVLAIQLDRQVSSLAAAIESKEDHVARVNAAWLGTSLLLSSLAALLTNASGEQVLRTKALELCIPSVVKALGMAHQHFPRSKGGRQEEGSVDSVDGQINALPNVKRDCVTIISNITHNNTKVQDEVRELHGIPLIMAQCNIDDLNPYLREHAMYCIRNLLDGNKTNQDMVDSIKPVGVQQTTELTDLGYRAELQNGNVGISRIPKIESINED